MTRGEAMSLGSATVTRTDARALTHGQWRIILLASLVGVVDLYEFMIYGIVARAIAAASLPLANLLASLGGQIVRNAQKETI